MRCKRHTIDFTSNIGVCASCLRERLFSLAASQNNPPPPPLIFPRSVSPYVAPRKSNAGGESLASSNNRFFATPQTSNQSSSIESSSSSFKKKRNGFSRFSSFFRTRSDDFDKSLYRSWISKVFSVRSRKQSTRYIEDLIASESDHHRQRFCRGMSPATDYERRTPAIETPGRRKTTATIGLGRSVSEMAFCLSPLVRAKPNWKGNFGYSGELKSPVKPHISKAASFCANRSKKLVDFGRIDPHR